MLLKIKQTILLFPLMLKILSLIIFIVDFLPLFLSLSSFISLTYKTETKLYTDNGRILFQKAGLASKLEYSDPESQ